VVGCAAFRRVNGPHCELKRVYVRPSARGSNIGRHLVEHMIHQARTVGYSAMCLDVLPEFVSAQRLYESLGFVPAEAVSYNPIPGTRFLALSLQAASSAGPSIDRTCPGSKPDHASHL
jgi:ribosomal protein S18 acetylase RimI-like enzyme